MDKNRGEATSPPPMEAQASTAAGRRAVAPEPESGGRPDDDRLRARLDGLEKANAQLRSTIEQLRHRVRNSLAIVNSITRRTAASSASVDEMTAHLLGRLDAFARVQSVVISSPAGVDLAGIICDEMLANAAHEGEQFSVQGPPVTLCAKAAESLSLAFHELATNAIKHGSLSTSGGHVQVTWTVERTGSGSVLALEWAEHATGGPAASVIRDGFGIELLTRVLPYELDASTEVAFAADGLRFTLRMPLPGTAQTPRPA